MADQFKYDKKMGQGMARPGTDRLAAVKQVLHLLLVLHPDP